MPPLGQQASSSSGSSCSCMLCRVMLPDHMVTRKGQI